MAPAKEQDDLTTLQAAINSTTALINNFRNDLNANSGTSRPPEIQNPPQPLALLADACKILKAQTTKLSLLILNKPFTPSAITYVLKSCSGSCLPAMMSALELCSPEKYTNVLHNHVKALLSKIMVELINLLASIPQDERGVEPRSRDILASTGVLWADCDKIIKLACDGIVFIVMEKVEEYHGLLKDAITELDEWDPEDDTDSDTDSVSSIARGQDCAPKDDNTASSIVTDLGGLSIVPLVNMRCQILAKLRTIRVLYAALKKRRISSFPNINSASRVDDLPDSDNILRLDALVSHMKYFTDAADETAGSLYDGDQEQVSIRLRSLQGRAFDCTRLMSKDWKGQEDEFTIWINTWYTKLEVAGEDC